ncbi:hypothetical protein EC968_004784 [Mortierella alpina]|nr:hypothetical protein EC968_004784 [Mortierella alpina]
MILEFGPFSFAKLLEVDQALKMGRENKNESRQTKVISASQITGWTENQHHDATLTHLTNGASTVRGVRTRMVMQGDAIDLTEANGDQRALQSNTCGVTFDPRNVFIQVTVWPGYRFAWYLHAIGAGGVLLYFCNAR